MPSLPDHPVALRAQREALTKGTPPAFAAFLQDVGEASLFATNGIRTAPHRAVRHDHGGWDGGGYSRGLRSGAIARASRLFALVDIFDVFTNDHPDRAAWSQARADIPSDRGGHFEPSRCAVLRMATRLGDARHGEVT